MVCIKWTNQKFPCTERWFGLNVPLRRGDNAAVLPCSVWLVKDVESKGGQESFCGFVTTILIFTVALREHLPFTHSLFSSLEQLLMNNFIIIYCSSECDNVVRLKCMKQRICINLHVKPWWHATLMAVLT